MREILFRGKCGYDNEWVEGFYYQAKLYRTGKELCHYITIPHPESDGQPSDHIMVHPDTVGQFTGLTDKNGKKIFEGDILRAKVYETEIEDSIAWGKHKVRTGNKIDAVWTVEHKIFNASCGYFIYGKDRRFHRLLTYSVIFNNECEVIGNIHDNPELLEGGAEDGK